MWMQTSCTLVRIVVCQRHWNGHGSCRSCRQGLQAPLAAQSSITEIWFVRCEWNLTWNHTHMASLDMHATYVLCVMSSLLWNWLQTCVNRLMHPCTSQCNLAGSPSIRCSADFPPQWQPGSIFKILHGTSYITPCSPLQSGRIINACNESLCCVNCNWRVQCMWMLRLNSTMGKENWRSFLLSATDPNDGGISQLKWYGCWILNYSCPVPSWYFPHVETSWIWSQIVYHMWSAGSIPCVSSRLQHCQKWQIF